MRLLGKIVGWLVASIVLLYVFLVYFSSVESKYECDGAFVLDGVTESATVFIRLEEYRPWVSIWSDADASLWLEIPNEHVEYFDNLVRVADSYQIWESQYGNKTGLRGNFSTLSGAFALDTHKGFYDGTCARIDNR